MVALWLFLLWQSPQPPTRWPIESLVVENPGEYSEAQILGYAGLATGQAAGKGELEAARRRLMDSGHFGGVGYRYKPSASGKGLAVTIELSGAGETYPVRFERLDADPEELASALKSSDPLYRDWIPPTPTLLERYAKVLEDFLAARNRKLDVRGALRPDRTDNLAVVFSPAARAPAIAQVQFAGSSAIPAEELQAAVAGVAIGAPYDEARFEKILDASVRPLYEAQGRIRAAFPKVTAVPAQGIDGVAVTVEVAEGEVYTLGSVRLTGEPLPEAELLEAAAFKPGEVADFSEVEAALGRIRQRLNRSGYLRAEVDLERTLDDIERRVDLTVRVSAGPQFLFGKLAVQGLDLDGEAQMRRLWALKPGSLFDPAYPDFFLSRIRQDGVFDNLGKTKVETRLDESSHTVDVTLRFAGR